MYGMDGRTNVDVGLVTGKGCVVPDAVHEPASALGAECILDGVDAAVELERRARGALEDSREARHCGIKERGRR